MKKFILIAVLVSALAALLAGTALAAGPTTSVAQGFGPGNGFRMWSNDQTPQDADYPCATAGGMMRGGAPEWAGESGAVEALLGMTADQIQAERSAGKSLAQIAAAKGISEEALINTILDAKKAQLAQLVTDGKLTQERVDLMVERMQAQVKAMVERTNVGPAFGQGQTRPGGMMQGFRGGRGANR